MNWAAYSLQEWLRGVDLDTQHGAKLTAHQAYLAVAWVRRCLELRANAVSSMPYAILTKGREEVDWPWPGDLRRLLWLTEGAMDVYGRAYWFRRLQRRRILNYRWLAPPSITEEYLEDGTPLFRRTYNGQSTLYTTQDVVYFWEPALDVEAGYGVGCVETALEAAGLSYCMSEFAMNFFRQGALPGVLLTVEGNPDEEELQRLETWWKRLVSGVKRAWDTVAIRSTVKPVQLGYPVDQLAMPELTQIVRQQIATAMGVPQTLLDDAASYATAVEHRLSFYQDTVVPRCRLIEGIINEQVLGPLGLKIEFREEELDIFQEDERNRASSLNSMVQAGLDLSLAMQILGYELPDGKTYEQWKQEREARQQASSAEDSAASDTTTQSLGVREPVNAENTPLNTRALLHDLAIGDIDKWQRKALRRLKAGDGAYCEFESDWIPEVYREAVKPLLQTAQTPTQVREAFRQAAGVVVEWRDIPPVPEDVRITVEDITKALAYWDQVMPEEYSGLLNAQVEEEVTVEPGQLPSQDHGPTPEPPAPNGNVPEEGA